MTSLKKKKKKPPKTSGLWEFCQQFIPRPLIFLTKPNKISASWSLRTGALVGWRTMVDLRKCDINWKNSEGRYCCSGVMLRARGGTGSNHSELIPQGQHLKEVLILLQTLGFPAPSPLTTPQYASCLPKKPVGAALCDCCLCEVFWKLC